MASISTSTGKSVFILKVISESPRRGMISDGRVDMNSNLGMVRLAFIQTVGDLTYQDHEIFAFTDVLHSWARRVEDIVTRGKNGDTASIDHTVCPHLVLNLTRSDWSYSSQAGDGSEIRVPVIDYAFFSGLSAAYLIDGESDWGSGPGMLLQPEGEDLLEFARALRAELPPRSE